MVRTALFWLHLALGVTAGLVILLLCLTGTALMFEKQIVDLAQREAWHVRPTGETLPVDDLVAKARDLRPEPPPSAITVSSDRARAWFVSTGRGQGYWIDPYSGRITDQGAEGWRSFFRATVALHRWLGAEGDARDTGRAITGAANAAFLVLTVSGLFLWFPRRWTRQAVRAVIWFRRGLSGKARDFNWHHVVGWWTLPVLFVLTLSGMVISYPWASDLVYVAAGEAPPATRGRQPPAQVPVDVPEGVERLALQALLDRAAVAAPGWDQLTLDLTTPPESAPTVSIRTADRWPRFATERVWLDPVRGEVLRHERFEDASPGRRARSWMRWLHTGEAFGWPGQLVAGLASAGGAVLVYTGLALAWRRFWRWWRRRPAGPA